jgi:BirA family biotin operon repressor/biotin-[acetyl-CoA-carboxylase] ligase
MFDFMAVRALLAGTRFADVHVVEETGSTNDDILPLLSREDPTPHTLVAEHQTRGKGRLNREWLDAPGKSLLWTTTLPPIAANSLWAVPFWVALRIAQGIQDATDLQVGLQWPNDILLDGRKLAGILCVSRIAGDRAVVGCGIGMNVVRPDERLELETPAAFINDYAATTREQLLACVLHRFDENFSELSAPRSIAQSWEARARLKGTAYRILRDGTSQPFTAIARAIADDGALILDKDGAEERVALGDARVLR